MLVSDCCDVEIYYPWGSKKPHCSNCDKECKVRLIGVRKRL